MVRLMYLGEMKDNRCHLFGVFCIAVVVRKLQSLVADNYRIASGNYGSGWFPIPHRLMIGFFFTDLDGQNAESRGISEIEHSSQAEINDGLLQSVFRTIGVHG
ncbi:MAG: hypothetical protein D6698_07405 [Gammaproteobacteria bacterium]|nr:MAG: hypothetical protein D6698_07405 [Gammaproteobacteria bacterium]